MHKWNEIFINTHVFWMNLLRWKSMIGGKFIFGEDPLEKYTKTFTTELLLLISADDEPSASKGSNRKEISFIFSTLLFVSSRKIHVLVQFDIAYLSRVSCSVQRIENTLQKLDEQTVSCCRSFQYKLCITYHRVLFSCSLMTNGNGRDMILKA